MINIINYNNIIDIEIDFKEEVKTKLKNNYLDAIIGNHPIEIDLCRYFYFIFFLQNNQEATKLIPLQLYKELINVVKQVDKKKKRKLLKATSPYIQAFFNHNNQYISAFCNCIDMLKKGDLCI